MHLAIIWFFADSSMAIEMEAQMYDTPFNASRQIKPFWVSSSNGRQVLGHRDAEGTENKNISAPSASCVMRFMLHLESLPLR